MALCRSIHCFLLLFLLGLHLIVPPTDAWKLATKTATTEPQTSSSTGMIKWSFGRAPTKPAGRLTRAVATVKPYAQPFVMDAGIWSALVFMVFDHLSKQGGRIGSLTKTSSRYVQWFVKFPGVAISLCYLFSVDLPKNQGMLSDLGWKWFSKSYTVFLFRFFLKSNVGFFQYALEGAVGLSTAIKMLRHLLIQAGY